MSAPVVAILMGDALNDRDALLSTVPMPSGIPVATDAVGSGGPPNASLFAIEILPQSDDRLRAALKAHKETVWRKVREADAALRADVEKV